MSVPLLLLCATACPAKVIEIEPGFDPDDPAHPK
jgi:NADH-quinone oxidoreductase subunit I